VSPIRKELVPTLRIAIPVVMAELGWMAMGVVDTIMVGPLGPQAISATGVGNSMHIAFAIFGMGVLLGLDTLVSQAFGARNIKECHRLFLDGLALAGLMAVPIVAVLIGVWYAIPFLGFHGAVRPLLESYFGIVVASTPFLLVYAACRRYLQGMHTVTPVMFALVTANVINAAANWVLIYGHFGLPALGVTGSAWATLISRIYMLAVLAVAVWWVDRERTRDAGLDEAGLDEAGESQRSRGSLWHVDWHFDPERLRRLLRLGLPAASQIGAEVGVFALATAMSGMLDPISSASHQIALNMAGLAFMIPLGMGSAGAVRVGHAVGAREPARVAASGWTAIVLGTGFMVASGLAFVLMPRQLIRLFSDDPDVLRVGTSLLLLGAVFQLFDGIQGVITGTLRGLGDTRTPMITNLAAHWLLGLPVSYTLCFILGWGVYGLWVGLSLGLIVTGITLFWVWTVRLEHYRQDLKTSRPQDLKTSRPQDLKTSSP
jgi:MATE family multidrug resistance protein